QVLSEAVAGGQPRTGRLGDWIRCVAEHGPSAAEQAQRYGELPDALGDAALLEHQPCHEYPVSDGEPPAAAICIGGFGREPGDVAYVAELLVNLRDLGRRDLPETPCAFERPFEGLHGVDVRIARASPRAGGPQVRPCLFVVAGMEVVQR